MERSWKEVWQSRRNSLSSMLHWHRSFPKPFERARVEIEFVSGLLIGGATQARPVGRRICYGHGAGMCCGRLQHR